MEVAIVLLKTGEYIIGFVEELAYEPSCHINQPYQLDGSYTRILDAKTIFKKWPKYTKDENILIESSNILTLLEPEENIKLAYLELTIPPELKKDKEEPPVFLTEQPTSPLDEEDDTYYVETGIDGLL
jgi:hypothetical protein